MHAKKTWMNPYGCESTYVYKEIELLFAIFSSLSMECMSVEKKGLEMSEKTKRSQNEVDLVTYRTLEKLQIIEIGSERETELGALLKKLDIPKKKRIEIEKRIVHLLALTVRYGYLCGAMNSSPIGQVPDHVEDFVKKYEHRFPDGKYL